MQRLISLGPVSTTHVASGAIVGVGLRSRRGAVRWSTASSMIAAPAITRPASAVVSAAAWRVGLSSLLLWVRGACIDGVPHSARVDAAHRHHLVTHRHAEEARRASLLALVA